MNRLSPPAVGRCGGGGKKENLACSNHRPFWIVVKVPEKDDDQIWTG
jgi:hypothetical protein